MRHTHISVLALALVLLAAPAAPWAYDGPVGVNLRAPLLVGTHVPPGISLGQLTLHVEAGDDDHWDPEIDENNRAFPDGYQATIATTILSFTLGNTTPEPTRLTIALPFDASRTLGTGFVDLTAITATVNDEPITLIQGPEANRSMFAVRSRTFTVTLPARSTCTIVVRARHSLARNPSWYSFRCHNDEFLPPGTVELASQGCTLELKLVAHRTAHPARKLKVYISFTHARSRVQNVQSSPFAFKGDHVKAVHIDPASRL